MQGFELESLLMGGDHSQTVKAPPIRSGYSSKDCVNLSSSTAVSRLNLETSVQDDKVMQGFELESLLMGGDHSQTVKAPPIRSGYSSKDCVNLSSSTAVSRLNLETAVQDDKVMQGFELESLLMGGDHSQTVKAPPIRSGYSSKDCVNLSSSTAVSRLNYPPWFYFNLRKNR
jgi:stage V sporulation protein SpoVS